MLSVEKRDKVSLPNKMVIDICVLRTQQLTIKMSHRHISQALVAYFALERNVKPKLSRQLELKQYIPIKVKVMDRKFVTPRISELNNRQMKWRRRFTVLLIDVGTEYMPVIRQYCHPFRLPTDPILEKKIKGFYSDNK